jgi:hypothetical protein
MLSRRIAVLCAPALLAFPAGASAEPFKDYLRPEGERTARAAQVQGTTQSYPAADGTLIAVTLAASYTGDPAIAQTYATYLGSLPHGPELASLRVAVVPAGEIPDACGVPESEPDRDAVLACYGGADQTMIVPAEQAAGSDISVNYVIAHEYGHHIARHRSNAPLPALDYGPKRWSSYELVCKNAADGRLAPGAQEGDGYFANPGEAWAEAYARLVFPAEAWRFTALLKPTQGSTLAAQADVVEPWAKRSVQAFKGRGTRSFTLPLTLDGALTLKLDGPSRTNYDIVLKSGGETLDRTTRRGSSDRIHYRIACRDRRTETLRISVVRRSGPPAPYTLTARYAG